jgi:putative SOS response-associated peptidase YedK
MCGRFALFCTKEELLSHYGLRGGISMASRFNIAPTQMVPVIRPKALTFARWGLVPHWNSPISEIPSGYINARIENISNKPSFRDAFSKYRCLIPVSGYYEWKVIKGIKQPYFISLRGSKIFSLAGILSCWRNEQGEEFTTFAVVTTQANEDLSSIHERMPVIISSDCYEDWLSLKVKLLTEDKIKSLTLKGDLSFYPVSRKVNNPSNDAQECVMHL